MPFALLTCGAGYVLLVYGLPLDAWAAVVGGVLAAAVIGSAIRRLSQE